MPKNLPKSKQTKKKIPQTLKSVEQFLGEAEELRELFQYPQAIAKLKIGLDRYPNNTQILDYLGEMLLENGDPENAMKAFKQSVKVAPDVGYNKYMYLGQIAQGKESVNFMHKGIQILQKMKQAASSSTATTSQSSATLPLETIKTIIAEGCSAIAELYLTDLCFEPDAEQQAEKAATAALQEDAKNLSSLLTLASVRMSQSRPNEAKEIINKAWDVYNDKMKRSKPAQPQEELLDEDDEAEEAVERPPYMLRLNMGKMLIEVGRYADSEQVLEQLVIEFSKVADVWYLLGVCAEKQNEDEAAFENYFKAVQLAKQLQEAGEEDPMFVKEITVDYQNLSQKLKQANPEAFTTLLQKLEKGTEDEENGGEDDWEDADDEEMKE